MRPGDTAVDATMGNGHDTLFLARLVGDGGKVHAFDIQAEAAASTRRRLADAAIPPERCELHLADHAQLLAVLPPETIGQIAAVLFNLGYLPGGDHRVITSPASTVAALDAALTALRPGGVLTAVVYPGHEGGAAEAAAVDGWAAALPQERFQALRYQFLNQRNRPPYVVAVAKRS